MAEPQTLLLVAAGNEDTRRHMRDPRDRV